MPRPLPPSLPLNSTAIKKITFSYFSGFPKSTVKKCSKIGGYFYKQIN